MPDFATGNPTVSASRRAGISLCTRSNIRRCRSSFRIGLESSIRFRLETVLIPISSGGLAAGIAGGDQGEAP